MLNENLFVGSAIWIIGAPESNVINTSTVDMHGLAAPGADWTTV